MLKNILGLSVRNIFLKKFAYLKVFAGFFFAFLIIFTVIFYSGSLRIAYGNYEDINSSDLMYVISSDLTEEQEKEIRAFPQVKSLTSLTYLYFEPESDCKLTLDGKDFVFNREDFYFKGRLTGRNSDRTFSENSELSIVSDGGAKFIKYGADLKEDNDILISEELLAFLDFGNAEELIGKEIEINAKVRTDETDENDDWIYADYQRRGKVCGITDGSYYRNKYDNTSFYCFAVGDEVIKSTVVSLKTFTGNEDFFDKMYELFGDKVTHFFTGISKLNEMKTVEGQEMLCNRFLSLICIVLFSVICVYVACNQYYLLLKNSVFYGILKAGGVNNRQVFVMHMSELAIILLLSLILAFAAAVGIFFIIKKLFSSFMFLDLEFSAAIAVISFFGFLALCLALAFAITLFIYNKILKKPPVYLLKK